MSDKSKTPIGFIREVVIGSVATQKIFRETDTLPDTEFNWIPVYSEETTVNEYQRGFLEAIDLVAGNVDIPEDITTFEELHKWLQSGGDSVKFGNSSKS